MIKELLISALLASGATLVGAPIPAAANIRLAEATIRNSSGTLSIEDVLHALARQVLLKEALGIEELSGNQNVITVTGSETAVGTLLQDICKREPRYRVVATADACILNILATDENTPSEQILNFHIPQINIEADDWPDHLIRELPGLLIGTSRPVKKDIHRGRRNGSTRWQSRRRNDKRPEATTLLDSCETALGSGPPQSNIGHVARHARRDRAGPAIGNDP